VLIDLQLALDGERVASETRFAWAGAYTLCLQTVIPRPALRSECHLFLCPIVVGGGKRALPGNVRAQLQLLDERRFETASFTSITA